MNWTSTKVPLWQIDCDNFRKVARPFQLKDVTTEGHRLFVELFSIRYDLSCSYEGTTATFEPRKSNKDTAQSLL
jgi:hypothetical protein